MGANAQTTVPTFVSGQVLTADQQNQSARTGVPVFAGTTERDAAFGGAGEKTLAEGQLCYLESTNVVQYYDGAAWATVGPATAPGLVLISTQTIGTGVSAVNFTNVFSSTYAGYRITYYHTSSTSSNSAILAQLGTGAATTTNYNGYLVTSYNPWGTNTQASQAVTSGFVLSYTGGVTNFGAMDLFAPNLARPTYAGGFYCTDQNGGFTSGRQTDNTQFTSLHVSAATGTITGGAISVYGYSV
jgi:hypothetical protein